MSKHDKKLDQAARAAWMYYVAGETQQDIAEKLGVSRQVAQRLVALATEQGLVSVNISHPVAQCMSLAEQLKARFGLRICQVVPSDGVDNAGIYQMVAVAGAEVMAQTLKQSEPQIIAVGSGRMLRATIDELPEFDRPQHSCVSLIGAIASDGSCTRYDVPLWMAEKTQGRYFILPAPLYADSADDRTLWCNHRIYRTVTEKAEQADVMFLGIGHVDIGCPLNADGFITREQVATLQAQHVVGEMLGHFIGEDGERVSSELDERLTSVTLAPRTARNIIAFSGGKEKHRAIAAVLKGGWISGLVTDEASARAVLAG
ncbi:sugar-binding transcriptional regulator [Erwiniaceae bacterium BAC15a-03b]|uniref:Sugar-binding transcriptional regulator n=1 Tax=Winslowiella arboricola TaxID=2978220 RepID=A0A9J6PZX8_9GAMM|nr:sugar-binding transcriptional regulator [Winslowiella arboricola]MCU5775599.1 sugar-binding transcriptional regulator [Winslowiella arboricola]MCU5779551.1 sugar-binding transcriptional regulator [Winslowiella arboricola]